MKKAWEAFMENGVLNDSVRPLIQHSWIRCREIYRLDPQVVKPIYKSPSELECTLKKNQALIQVSRSIMENVSSILGECHYVVSLTDRTGTILVLFGDKEVLRSLEPFHVKVGAVWQEEVFGTSGPGTSMKLGQPCVVTGFEHYSAAFHSWTCASSPIPSAQGGNYGVLTIATNTSQPGTLLLPMVVSLSVAVGQAYETEIRHEKQLAMNYSILDNVDDLILLIDQDGVIVSMNYPPFYSDIFSRNYNVGDNYMQLSFEGELLDNDGEYNSLIIETLMTGKEYSAHEYRRTLSYTTKVLLIDTKQLKRGDKVVGAIMVAKDITEKKRMEERLFYLDKFQSLSKLAAGLAHEIRNPLTTSLGFLQLINRDTEKPPARHHLQLIEEEMIKINDLVNEFLLLSKPSAPQMKPESMKDWLRTTVNFMQGEAALRGIELLLEADVLEENDVYLEIDILQMQRLIINLVKNSFDASEPRSHVILRVNEITHSFVSLEVVDFGEGMDAETQALLFDPFYSKKSHGTGLGMTIVYQIVQGHHGDIQVTSIKGKGTVVKVQLPLTRRIRQRNATQV